MFQLYAIDPEVFESEKAFSDLFERFGDDRPHRYILGTPKKEWQRTLYKKLKGLQLSEISRKIYVERLKALDSEQKRVVAGSNGRAAETDWLSSFRDEIFSSGADGIFVGDKLVDVEQRVFSWTNPITFGPAVWSELKDSFDLSAEGFDSICRPLIRISSEFHLVDPYIWPHANDNWSRTSPILEVIASRIQEGCGETGNRRLTIHTSSVKAGIQAYLSQYRYWWREFCSKFSGLHIQFKVWPEASEHDRFFFTDRGGVSLSNSFQEKTAEICEAKALSSDRLRDLRRKYIHSPQLCIEEGSVLDCIS